MHRSHRSAAAGGFTLVELLVVTAVLGVLAVLASNALVGVASLVSESGVAAATPELSDAALLVRLTGAAVLLFGGGFWYLAELRRPGALDDFRLGQFLLLALTFSLFFVVYAVLDARAPSPTAAVAIAAAVSFPLVTMHVATIVDPRFALGSALPLAAFATAIVVAGAHGGDARALLFLGMAVAAVAFVTWSQPRLVANVTAHRRAFAAALAPRAQATAAGADTLRAALADADAALRTSDPASHAAARRWLERRVTWARRTLDLAESFVDAHEAMPRAVDRSAGWERARATARLAGDVEGDLERAERALVEATGALLARRAATRQRAREDEATRRAPSRHCVACGHDQAPGDAYCARCGRPGPELRRCGRCTQTLLLPRHLLRRREDGAPAKTHCHACGEPHATAG